MRMIKTHTMLRFTFPVLAIIIPLAMCATLGELIARLIGTRSPVIHSEMFVWSTSDPQFPYRLRPSYHGSYAGGAVHVDPDGNRVVPNPIERGNSPHLRRIVLLGDSVAFGQGLDDAETIAANLQRHDLISKETRVVSVAAPGYTSWNEYKALERYFSRSKADVVVLIYVNNDLTNDDDHFKFNRSGGKIAYMERSPFFQLTRFLYDHSRLFFLITDSIKKINYTLGRLSEPSTQASDSISGATLSNLDYSMSAVEKMHDLCEREGADFIVVIYRDGSFYKDPKGVARYEDAVGRALRDRRIPYLVAVEATKLPLDKYALSWNDHAHPSASAAKILADEISQYLNHRSGKE